MSTQTTARHDLPYLFVGQAQKEITHNEALIRIDAILNPVIQKIETVAPVNLTLDDSGKCWLIGPSASGQWASKENQIAYWTGGSWRYLELPIGAAIFNIDQGVSITKTDTGWYTPTNIADVTGGTVVDSQSRIAINAILSLLRSKGQIAV